MAGRAGRGAAIAKYLADKKAAEEGLLQTTQQPGIASDEPLQTPLGGRGRAMAMMRQHQLMLQQQQQSVAGASSAPEPSSLAPSTQPQVGGRGRAPLLVHESSIPARQQSPPAPVQEMQSLRVEPPTEPIKRHGESGRRIKATANYIRLDMEKGKGVFEYEVIFDPEVDSVNMRYKFFNEHRSFFGAARTFDGVILYLPWLLDNRTTILPCAEGTIQMTVIYKRVGQMSNSIHLYNVLFKRIMMILNLVRLGRQFYSPVNKVEIKQHRLEVWPGYVTAVDEYEGGIMLCLDSSHRVLRMTTVYDMMRETSGLQGDRYKEAIIKDIVGQSVLTRYNNKMYRVDDIDWDKNPKTTFDSSRGGPMTFADYYKNHYELSIKDLGQPLLISRVTRKNEQRESQEQLVCLIPELCFVTGLTDAMRSDFKVMKDINAHTRITPNQRKLAMKKFIGNIRSSTEAIEVLKGWGLTIASDSVELSARVAECENITFGRNVTVPGTPQADWGMAAGRNRALETVDLRKWCVLHCPRDKNAAGEFITWMKKTCPQMGMDIADPKVVALKDDRIDAFLSALRSNILDGIQLAVIICPTARDDRYSAIKKLCCSEMPVASQVINARTLGRPEKNRSIVQKIALQINCKLGGTLWSVRIPFTDIMIIGIDTFHDASKKGDSVGGFVASINGQLTKWFSRVAIQLPKQELMENLKANFVMALKKYHQMNHRYPDRIIIYRDGVGDGQLRMSRDFEVQQFKTCFKAVNAEYSPKLSMVICQKRINTRIFACLGGGQDNLENPPPGTIIDNTINRRNWYDFFLVSQHVRQGTVTPTHYVVVHDECDLKPDHMQRLTYKLCHLYYNWPGTIRVPAPVQYAHKLAQLVGQNIHRQPAEVLSDKLYFL